eukprot:3194375-Rhodomonas_salina.1
MHCIDKVTSDALLEVEGDALHKTKSKATRCLRQRVKCLGQPVHCSGDPLGRDGRDGEDMGRETEGEWRVETGGGVV